LTAPASQPAAPREASVSIGGAIDIGSNSVHLLVALVGPDWVEPLRDASELLGLGEVVDRVGEIPADERARLVDVLRIYTKTAQRSHAERLTLLGTEPLRRARNSTETVAEIAAATGLSPRILTTRDEAVLTFIGVTRGLVPDAPLIVIDIGGGSTEVSTFVPGTGLRVDDIPFGSARLTNAIVEHDPPTDDELDRLFLAASDATAALAGRDQAVAMSGARAVFVGGTATNVARLGRLTRAALAEDRRTLEKLPMAAVSSRFNVRPRRARQLAAGVAIVELLLERFGLDSADVSDASLRDGAIIAAARLGDSWTGAFEDLVAG
jgi:exopolyphosphatase/guanosine-5'-triphosphate,3'-diphosphate pyrophosphatase